VESLNNDSFKNKSSYRSFVVANAGSASYSERNCVLGLDWSASLIRLNFNLRFIDAARGGSMLVGWGFYRHFAFGLSCVLDSCAFLCVRVAKR
jgi:hypothetical protein